MNCNQWMVKGLTIIEITLKQKRLVIDQSFFPKQC